MNDQPKKYDKSPEPQQDPEGHLLPEGHHTMARTGMLNHAHNINLSHETEDQAVMNERILEVLNDLKSDISNRFCRDIYGSPRTSLTY
jgi:hypothetical protein